MNATELFRLMLSDTDITTLKGKKKRHSPRQHMPHIRPPNASEDISPQRFAFSQLALDGSLQHANGKQEPSNQLGHNNHGLLPSVIEASSQTSSQSRARGCESSSKLSRTNSMDSSIATKASLDTKPSMVSYRTLPLGKCLTQPSAPVANEGLDNADGNLVVHENDVIRISRKQIHVLTKDKMRDVTQADFRIQSLLGQGTFAQVFQCLHLQTGKLVAIKIVKNKPAYTRQAAVELDIFRALTKREENVGSSSMSQNRLSVSPNNSVDGTVSSGGAKWDYMVDLVCYFLYKSHLCLVFELLGLNLYEVLKQRQFRGLPLSVVRTLVKQAVGGVAELAKKSIVHCDLKPENILLVSDDDVNSVVGARRSAKISSSFEQTTASELTKAINGNRTPPKKGPVLASGLSKAMGGNQGSALADGSAGVLSRSPESSLGTAGTRRMSPGSSLGTAATRKLGTAATRKMNEQKIKLIDFGSACFEGQTTHTYIQSRFYRSPEVLIGLPYDSAIDMWSLGCVAGELFLGLPILPGVHEHDQLGRISEMISILPNWMLDQGSKSSNYFVKDAPRSKENQTETPELQDPSSDEGSKAPPSPQPPQQWRIRSQQEYIASLSQNEIRKKGGLAKLEKQPTNRYFKKRKLADIISHKGQSGQPEDKHDLDVFIHFLYGK
jgi:serine/threonine protein kinase